MLHKLDMGQFKDGLRRYFKGSDSLGGQPLPEVNKALIEDAPRVVRLTIWGVILFFVFLIVWASVAPIDEVTRGEGKAIPSSKVQKIQNLEGGIVAEIFAKEGQIVEVGQPLLRLRRAEVENRGQMDSTALAIPRAEAAIREVQSKIEETRGKFRSEALTQLNEARTELSKATATSKALDDRVHRTMVTSPVRGIVKQLLVNTIGGVIQPGSDMPQFCQPTRQAHMQAMWTHPMQHAGIKY